MSRTYSFICRDCKVHLWVGQSVGPDFEHICRVYSGDEHTDRQVAFLQDHAGHAVAFGENVDIGSDFVELYDEDDEADEKVTVDLTPLLKEAFENIILGAAAGIDRCARRIHIGALYRKARSGP